mmetsp:Transcript_38156/g.107819  ORF Transcript_38156/g.107819 Transcript_38156/m.107819 type:complete len:270 (+) Transcript_38156:133-942(+)
MHSAGSRRGAQPTGSVVHGPCRSLLTASQGLAGLLSALSSQLSAPHTQLSPAASFSEPLSAPCSSLARPPLTASQCSQVRILFSSDTAPFEEVLSAPSKIVGPPLIGPQCLSVVFSQLHSCRFCSQAPPLPSQNSSVLAQSLPDSRSQLVTAPEHSPDSVPELPPQSLPDLTPLRGFSGRQSTGLSLFGAPVLPSQLSILPDLSRLHTAPEQNLEHRCPLVRPFSCGLSQLLMPQGSALKQQSLESAPRRPLCAVTGLPFSSASRFWQR